MSQGSLDVAAAVAVGAGEAVDWEERRNGFDNRTEVVVGLYWYEFEADEIVVGGTVGIGWVELCCNSHSYLVCEGWEGDFEERETGESG